LGYAVYGYTQEIMAGASTKNAEHNCNFVANARTDVPDLVSEVLRLRGELAAWEPVREQCLNYIDDYAPDVHPAFVSRMCKFRDAMPPKPKATPQSAPQDIEITDPNVWDLVPGGEKVTPQPAPDCSASAMVGQPRRENK
jgi:hypothetical protein